MQKKEIIEAVIAECEGKVNANKKEIKYIIESFLSEVVDNLVNGEEIRLNGFGKFTVKVAKARKARNPITGESVDVPAKNKLYFKIAKGLKEAIQ